MITSTFVTAALLGAAALLTAPAPPARAALPDLSSSQFDVVDYGSYAVTYSGHTDPDGMLVTKPKDATSFVPGDFRTWAFNKNIKKHTATLAFGDTDAASPARGRRSLTITLTTSDTSDNNIVHVACSGSGYVCQVQSNRIYLVDDTTKFPELATRTVSDAQDQYELLKNLCTGATTPSCTFTATTRKAGFGDPQRRSPVYPSGPLGMTHSETHTFETATTTSFSQTVTVGASYSVFKSEVHKTYSTEVTDARTESQTITFDVPPNMYMYIEVSAAAIRYTGEFTLRMGKSVITLSGVYYDVVDKTRTSLVDVVFSDTDPGYGTVAPGTTFGGLDPVGGTGTAPPPDSSGSPGSADLLGSSVGPDSSTGHRSLKGHR